MLGRAAEDSKRAGGGKNRNTGISGGDDDGGMEAVEFGGELLVVGIARPDGPTTSWHNDQHLPTGGTSPRRRGD